MIKSIISFALFIASIGLSIGQPIGLNLLSNWTKDGLVPSNAHFNTYNEVWGYATNGKEYAIIGSTAGTHIIDVTDPVNIFEAFFIEGAATGTSIIHRDYHDYKGYLYAVCDESSQSTIQVIDLNGLPDTVITVYDSNEFFSRAHNIFIDTATAKLYSLLERGNAGSFAFGIYDISDPVNPVKLSAFNQLAGQGIGHVHDGYVENDTAYLNCGYDGFYLIDASDAENPVVLDQMADYPDAGYNHSGWISTDGNYYYMADENHGFDIKVIDVSDKNALEVISTFNADSESPSSIPHNLIVACDYLYVSYYYDGLQIYDISDPANPVRSFYYATSTEQNQNQYRGAWGVYPFLPSGNILVSDMQNGLFVVESIDPSCNQLVSDVTSETNSHAVSIFPNPNFGQLNIENLPCTENIEISVLNQQGVMVMKMLDFDCQQKQFSIDHLDPGIYFVQFQIDQSIITKKIILHR